MKKYLKIKNVFLLLIIISISACNSDDDSSSSSENGGVKYLSTVTANIGPADYPRYARKDTLVYKNGKVVKALLSAGCTISVQQYEYGNNGKISTIYEAWFNYDGYPNAGDLIDMFETSTIDNYDNYPTTLEYDSENRLVKTDDGFSLRHFEYDNEGRFYKKTIASGVVYTAYNFDDNGNPLLVTSNDSGSSEEVYEYGTLKNPYYDLFHKYGLVDLSCVLGNTIITPNVVTSRGNRDFVFYSDGGGNYPSSVHDSDYVYDLTYL